MVETHICIPGEWKTIKADNITVAGGPACTICGTILIAASLPAGPAAPQTPLIGLLRFFAERLLLDGWLTFPCRTCGRDGGLAFSVHDLHTMAIDAADALSRASSPSPSAALREKVKEFRAEQRRCGAIADTLWKEGDREQGARYDARANALGWAASEISELLGSTESP